MDGREHAVPDETLAALVEVLEIDRPRAAPPPGIAEALAEKRPPRCHVPADLRRARAWGLTCQVASLASARNLGMGDFVDLASLCRLAGAEGAEFVGVNPLHALFWSDPARVSPFFPSNRRFLNPLYIAPEWIDCFAGISAEEEAEAARLRVPELVDVRGAAALKDRVLRRVFEVFRANGRGREAFHAFCAQGGEALRTHALFEALSETMAAEGHGAGWTSWPAAFRNRHGSKVRTFAADYPETIDYHLWLQWVAAGQLARVRREAQAAGMRIGLYLDLAVGAAPDGSASWTDPYLTLPGVSVGAPPDDLAAGGQDWGLAPLSPIRLDALEGRPLADILAAVMGDAGAIRLDHAMGIARLWLIPRGAPAGHGAYVRYPLSHLLARVAEASQAKGTIVIGEDLGTVPKGFRKLMRRRRLHTYKVFLLERGRTGFVDPARWPIDAFACAATHDMPTFAGWWREADLDLKRDVGIAPGAALPARRLARGAEREELARLLGASGAAADVSARLHGYIAASRCRLVALQVEDALGVTAQVNVPGTRDEYPNWRRRLPVAVESLADHPGFRAHVAALRLARPR